MTFRMIIFRFSVFIVSLMVLLLSGCSTPSAPRPATVRPSNLTTYYLGSDGRVVSRESEARKEQPEGFWNGDGVSGAPSIVINLSEQTANFYKGGKLVGQSPISTGREGYRTPAGSFRVTQKSRNHVSNLYGNFVDSSGNIVVANVGVHRDRRPPGTVFQGAPMPYFLRINGAVGMHAGYLPGYPDSHGCIRLPENMAATYFANVSHGTPVRVVY